ncbi:hypothetical protein ROZALSC1DRAFT_23571, partial [Rozella allomycis CSF55]
MKLLSTLLLPLFLSLIATSPAGTVNSQAINRSRISPWKSFKNFFKGKKKNTSSGSNTRSSNPSRQGQQGRHRSASSRYTSRAQDQGSLPSYEQATRQQVQRQGDTLPRYTTIDRRSPPIYEHATRQQAPSALRSAHGEAPPGYTTVDRSPNSRPFVNSKSDVSTTIKERYKIDSPD